MVYQILSHFLLRNMRFRCFVLNVLGWPFHVQVSVTECCGTGPS